MIDPARPDRTLAELVLASTLALFLFLAVARPWRKGGPR